MLRCFRRYHPIDDEDDITETGVTDGSNKVVLRRKSEQAKNVKKTTQRHTTCYILTPVLSV